VWAAAAVRAAAAVWAAAVVWAAAAVRAAAAVEQEVRVVVFRRFIKSRMPIRFYATSKMRKT
jgi:hypothetical protein